MDCTEDEDLYTACPSPPVSHSQPAGPAVGMHSHVSNPPQYTICAFRSLGCKYVCTSPGDMAAHTETQVSAHSMLMLRLLEKLSSQSSDVESLKQRVAVVERDTRDQQSQLVGTDVTVEKMSAIQDMHNVTINHLGVTSKGLKTHINDVYSEMNTKLTNLHCLFDDSYQTICRSVTEAQTQLGNLETKLNEVTEKMEKNGQAGNIETKSNEVAAELENKQVTAVSSGESESLAEYKAELKKCTDQITDLEGAHHALEQTVTAVSSGESESLAEYKAELKKCTDQITDLEGAHHALEQTVFDLVDKIHEIRQDLTSPANRKDANVSVAGHARDELLGAVGGDVTAGAHVAVDSTVKATTPDVSVQPSVSEPKPSSKSNCNADCLYCTEGKRKYERDQLFHLREQPVCLTIPVELRLWMEAIGIYTKLPKVAGTGGQAGTSTPGKPQAAQKIQPLPVRAKSKGKPSLAYQGLEQFFKKMAINQPNLNPRSMKDIKTGLEFIIEKCDSSNDKVINWIERMVSFEQREEDEFIHSLMTSICRNVIRGLDTGSPQVDWSKMMDRCELLSRYFHDDKELQVEALSALESLMDELGDPPGLEQMFLDILQDKDTIMPNLLALANSQKGLNRSNSTVSTDTKESESSVKKEDQLDAAVQSAEDTGGSNDDAKPKSKAQITKAEDTTDSIRIKCRQTLTLALEIAGHIEGAPEFADIAAAIEDYVYKEFKKTDAKYKTRIRSRVSNLQDSRNPTLRQSVLLGDISPERIAVMTSEEMASEDLKQLRVRYTKEAIDDHQMATTSGTKTDLLKCGKCGKRNCTYNLVQTTTADALMTTFVVCNECGHRWKLS